VSASMFRPRIAWLLVFMPVAIVLRLVNANPELVFAASALAIVPLAYQIGKGTEQLAAHAGSQVGGLLNATFANVTELIVSFFLILKGETEVVKASLTGSIISNILLVLGLSFIVGGVGRERQRFNAESAGLHTASLVIAVTALLMPALFRLTPGSTRLETETISIGVAVVLLILYAGSLLFSLKTHQHIFRSELRQEEPTMPRRDALLILGTATVAVAVMSELLVGALEPTVQALGMSRLFVGLIIVPILGNAAENSSAIMLAAKDKMEISIEIAANSSVQMALFVAPVLVFLSLLLGHPMNFIFTGLEISAVFLSTLVLAFISRDGESTWFEGAQMLAAYIIMALSFFFL
jgi:Ca2+:H+ antiporter